tara:strand:+ start:1620 stop:2027 length:408 start_codon:yes stop_codon:yes gene_type:complete
MVLKQKYIQGMKKKETTRIPHDINIETVSDDRNKKSLLVDRYVVTKIEKNATFVANYLLEVIERITNKIDDDTSLAVIVNDIRRNDIFFELWFDIVSPWEIYLYDIEEVSSDRYLDLMLEDRIISTHNRRIRNIF